MHLGYVIHERSGRIWVLVLAAIVAGVSMTDRRSGLGNSKTFLIDSTVSWTRARLVDLRENSRLGTLIAFASYFGIHSSDVFVG